MILRGSQKFRLYVDESGDHTFQLVDKDNHRYLGLLGLWFNQDTPYKNFCRELSQLKQDAFGWHPDDPPICLHRKDLIDRKGVFRRLRDPAVNELFEGELLRIVKNARFLMAGVVIDKASHRTKTYRELFHPYHYCLTALLERYAGWLERQRHTGDVMAESRGGREDQELRSVFGSTMETGTRFHSSQRFQAALTSRDIKLKKKENAIAGLELADLLAYPLKREMIAEQRGESPPQDFSSALLDVARPRLNCHLYNGANIGVGQGVAQLKNERAPRGSPCHR